MNKLSEDEVRQALNAWCDQGWFRIRGLGDKVALVEFQRRDCHTVQVTSQYESRKVAQTHVPYDCGPIDNVGQPLDRWDLAVRRPRDFEERTEQLPVPHTERVVNCPECGGSGKRNCRHCQGAGKCKCPFCHGHGHNMATKEPCRPCQGSGSQPCTWCHGRGRVACDDCRAQGQVKFFHQLTATFRVEKQQEPVGNADLPPHLVVRAPGEEVLDRRAERVGGCSPIADDVDVCLARLLQRSHRQAEGDTRLLFERVEVEPVAEADGAWLRSAALTPRRAAAEGGAETPRRGGAGKRREASVLQPQREGVADRRVIVHNQHASPACSCPRLCGRVTMASRSLPSCCRAKTRGVP
jgi:hypothetical protein